MERMLSFIRFLEENYAEPAFGLAQLSEYAGISSQRLNYLFKRTTGRRPYQYLIHLRVQKAKEYLINDKKLTVKAIASLVGFLARNYRDLN